MTQQIQVVENAITNAGPIYRQSLISHNYGLIADTQLHAAKMQIMKSKFTFSVAAQNPDSLINALTTAGTLGLDLTEGKRQGWLIPRKLKSIDNNGNEVERFCIVLQTGYKGVEAIHQRLGIIKRLSITSIHANDSFSWSGDDQEKPQLQADWNGERGPIVGAFSVTYFPDDSFQVKHAPVTEIFEKHRDKSDSWKSEKMRPYSPWATHEKMMIEKTMAFIAAKQWPASSATAENASEVLTRLHEADTQDYSDYKGDAEIIQAPYLSGTYQMMVLGDSLGVYLYWLDNYERLVDEGASDEECAKFWENELQGNAGFKAATRAKNNEMRNAGLKMFEGIQDYANTEEPDLTAIHELIEDSCGPTRTRLINRLPDFAETIKAAWKEGQADKAEYLAKLRKEQDNE